MIVLLTDGEVNCRWATAWALGEIGVDSAEVINALIAALGDEDFRPRFYAAISLSKLGKKAVQPVIKALENDRADVRWVAIDSLGRMGPGVGAADATAALARLLATDPEARLRQMAASALGRIGPPADGARDAPAGLGPQAPPEGAQPPR